MYKKENTYNNRNANNVKCYNVNLNAQDGGDCVIQNPKTKEIILLPRNRSALRYDASGVVRIHAKRESRLGLTINSKISRNNQPYSKS